MPQQTTREKADWWLARLTKQLQTEQTRITALRAYVSGDAPLPEGAEELKEAYKAFQKKARTNFAEIVVEAVAERMVPSGFSVNGADDLNDKASEIWNANELGVFAGDVHEDMLTVGDGYVIVGEEGDEVVITYEDAASVITEQDPKRRNKVRAALKQYRDEADEIDYAYLYLPGEIWVAKKEKGDKAYSWVKDKSPQKLPKGMEDVIPVVRFPNRNHNGEFEAHTDTIDRINWMTLQRLVVVALQAFRQRAIKGEFEEIETDGEGAPVLDEDNEPIKIDYDSVFRPGPGAVWVLPEGSDVWESSATDITPILAGVKDDIRDLAACTRTPMSMVLPDSANQSAEGATAAREGLVFKIKDRIRRATYGWNQVMRLALLMSGETDVKRVDTHWLPPDMITLAEKADAASKATDIPWKTKMRSVWQYSPVEIDQMERERAVDFVIETTGQNV